MDRRNTFMWMKDIVDHLRTCADQWQTSSIAGDGVWAEAVSRDLDELQRLCETLRCTVAAQQPMTTRNLRLRRLCDKFHYRQVAAH